MDTLAQVEGSGLTLLKIGILILIFLYILFSAVVIRQVRSMTDALRVGFENPVKFIAVLHFFVSIIVFIIALIIL